MICNRSKNSIKCSPLRGNTSPDQQVAVVCISPFQNENQKTRNIIKIDETREEPPACLSPFPPPFLSRAPIGSQLRESARADSSCSISQKPTDKGQLVPTVRDTLDKRGPQMLINGRPLSRQSASRVRGLVWTRVMRGCRR